MAKSGGLASHWRCKGSRTVRIANLPPELANSTLRMVVGNYGVVQDIENESIFSFLFQF